MQTCERCRATASGEYELLDYCAICSRNLCEKCMEQGCCGHKPAKSGMLVDQLPSEEADALERRETFNNR